MWYITNNNKIVFRSKDKSKLESKLEFIKKHSFGDVSNLKLTNIKPTNKPDRLNVSILSYND